MNETDAVIFQIQEARRNIAVARKKDLFTGPTLDALENLTAAVEQLARIVGADVNT